METHSSREGGFGSHRRLLERIENSATRTIKAYQKSRIAAGNNSTGSHSIPTICGVPVTIRQFETRDFAALYKLDQACFPPGIAYSKTMLRYFLAQAGAECLVAMDASKIVGFMVSEENPPLAHIVTLDIAGSHRRRGVGTELLREGEANLRFRGVRTVLLETAITNETAIAFWERHGYRREAVLKNYYPGQLDAFAMRKKLGATARPGS